MKIGILGTGHIGKTLVLSLSEAAHDVKVANSRGPQSIEADMLVNGARAVTATEALTDVEVVILSIPLNRLAGVAPQIASLPAETVIIDTSNYYPVRDTEIAAIDAGQVESLWVVDQLGRTVVKAWNAIGSDSFARLGKPAGDPDRLAIPVAGDDDRSRRIGMALVNDTGFDAVDAGPLSESWRQQPGAPCYCTDLTRDEMPAALAAAERERLPKRRDLGFAAVIERIAGNATNPSADYLVRLNRALFM